MLCNLIKITRLIAENKLKRETMSDEKQTDAISRFYTQFNSQSQCLSSSTLPIHPLTILAAIEESISNGSDLEDATSKLTTLRRDLVEITDSLPLYDRNQYEQVPSSPLFYAGVDKAIENESPRNVPRISSFSQQTHIQIRLQEESCCYTVQTSKASYFQTTRRIRSHHFQRIRLHPLLPIQYHHHLLFTLLFPLLGPLDLPLTPHIMHRQPPGSSSHPTNPSSLRNQSE